MIRIGLVAGALAILSGGAGAVAADQKLDAALLATANNTAAIAAVKADSGSGFAMGSSDIANSQLSSRGQADALGSDKPAAIGSHAFAVMPDDGSMKKGVLNARIEASALAADPQIGSSPMGSGNAAQQADTRDFMK